MIFHQSEENIRNHKIHTYKHALNITQASVVVINSIDRSMSYLWLFCCSSTHSSFECLCLSLFSVCVWVDVFVVVVVAAAWFIFLPLPK